MKIKLMPKVMAFVLAGTILFSSCASTTMITSTPSGAKVYVEQQQLGTTPYAYSDTKAVGAKTLVKLTKEGYEDFFVTIKKDELNAGRLVVGILLLWPVLIWCTDYPDTYHFELNKADGNDVSVPFALPGPGVKEVSNSEINNK